MSEKLVSLSDSSPNLKPPPRRNGDSNGEAPYLAIVNQIPKHLYPDESFSVQLELVVPNGCKPPPSEIEIVASLYHANTGSPYGAKALLIMEPSQAQIRPTDNSGYCIVLCRVQMEHVIRQDEEVPLYIRFSSRACAFPPTFSVASVNTNPFQLVNYKIRISWKGDWESDWYKDEGSRKRSIEVQASMNDSNGVPRTGEQIPLRLTLCYFETQTPVDDQDDVLQLRSGPVSINGESGMARIRYRLNDVSRKHRNLGFVLLIETKDDYKDVAPAFTPSVKVLSKRVKRPRSDSSQGAEDSVSRPARRRVFAEAIESPDASVDREDKMRLVQALRSVVNWADEMMRGLDSIRCQDYGYGDYSIRAVHNVSVPIDFIETMFRQYDDTVVEGAHGILRDFGEPFGWSSRVPPRTQESHSVEPWPHSHRENEEGRQHMVAYILAKPYQGTRTGRYLGLPAYNINKQILGFYNFIGGRNRQVFSPLGNHEEDFGSFEIEWATSNLEREVAQCSSAALSLREWGSLELLLDQAFAFLYNNRAPSTMNPQPTFWGPPSLPGFPAYPGPHVRAVDPNEHRHYAHSMPRRTTQLPRRPLPPPMYHGLKSPRDHEESRECEVAFVLAKESKGNSGRRLGFPAYNANKELLGFYLTVGGSSRREFSPIWKHQQDFGSFEIGQATLILENEMLKGHGAVLRLREGDSIDRLLDQALVVQLQEEVVGEEVNQRAPV